MLKKSVRELNLVCGRESLPADIAAKKHNRRGLKFLLYLDIGSSAIYINRRHIRNLCDVNLPHCKSKRILMLFA